MEHLEILRELFSDYTLRTVALGAATLGIVSGALGSYAVLRKQSLLGDAMSHAALPGIALAFMLTGSKEPIVLILGAAVAGWVGTLLIMGITNTTRIKYDSAMGIVLAVFFGLGLVLLTLIQRTPEASKAGLDRFLFGQAAALIDRDVITMASVGGVALVVMLLFWKELKLLSFDPDFGSSLGFGMRTVDILLTTLLVVAIVLGLQTVGVVLMSAMVVAPGAAARQWTNRLGSMVALSSLFGALAGITGALISSTIPRMPTGPTIVICISAIVLVSILFAPERGIFWEMVRRRRGGGRVSPELDALLLGLYEFAGGDGGCASEQVVPALRLTDAGFESAGGSLEELEELGLVREVERGRWGLTPAGGVRAEKLAKRRKEGDERGEKGGREQP